jgi:MFS family permease
MLGLSRPVWRLEAGALINAIGTGFVMPFSVIYLHDVRGFSLGVAGATMAVLGGAGVVTGPIAGSLCDRQSAHAVLVASLLLIAVGYVLFAFARSPWQAMAVAVVIGSGGGAYYPSHDSMLAALTAGPTRGLAFSLERTIANMGYGIGGLLGGLIATTNSSASFQALFLTNAGSCLLFVACLAHLPSRTSPTSIPSAPAGSYRAVFADRGFVTVLAINAALLTAGYGTFQTLVPAYAETAAHVSPHEIGGFFLIGTWLIVAIQIPVARLTGNRSQSRLIVLLSVLWALSLLIVLAAGETLAGTLAAAAIAFAFILFTIGESLQAATISPLASRLAPPHLQGRYLALLSLTWDFALTAGPGIGGYALSKSPTFLWVGAAGACLAAGLCARLLNRGVEFGSATSP